MAHEFFITCDRAGVGGSGAHWPGSTITAASATQAAVQTAVDAASNGDIVQIPNGSQTWTGGISTSKQILIRAQNYTPSPAGTEGAGTTTRNVTLTNNSASALFTFTTGSTYHQGIAGIAFVEGGGDGSHLAFSGSGTKVPLIWDCYFENSSRTFPQEQIIVINCRGGVMWNCYMEGTQPVTQVGEGSLLVKLPSAVAPSRWTDASTMGMADTDGNINFYVEDSTFLNCGACPDIDDHGRFVCRNFIYDGTWGATHGFTSTWGGKHWEYYDGIFDSNTPERNFANRYFWCRAGTGLFTGNVVRRDYEPSDYGGEPEQLNIGDNTAPSGAYLIARQPGCGHNGSAYVSDPIYIWSQSGDSPSGLDLFYNWGFQDDPGDWSTVVVDDRDIFVNNGAKPGWTRYTYPHPLREGAEG